MIRVCAVLGVAAVGGPSLTMKVHAAASETTQSHKKKIHPSQLPIYGEPVHTEIEVIPEEETAFHKLISDARKSTWGYMDSIQTTTDKVKEKWEVAKVHTKDALAYIQEDTAVLPRAAIITVSGLGGIIAGYRGGLLRKAFYASIGMTAAASLCYPNQAAEIGKDGWHIVRDFAYKTYEDATGSGSQGKQPEVKKKIEEASKQKETKNSSSKPDDSVKKDFGMSKPEDKDMYTTREK